MPVSYKNPILFFDGVCGLCNHTVDFVLQRDKVKKMKFSPLQGQLARELLPIAYVKDLKTLILYDDGQIYAKSEAVIRIGRYLGGGWSVAAKILRFVPKLLRDFVYDLIAYFRYRFFGKREVCRMPSPDERQRFLD